MFKALYLFLFISSLGLHAASFNCNKAQTSFEKAICSDETLSLLDSNLGSLYRQAKNIATQSEYENIIQEQKLWFSQRRLNCPNAQTPCLTQYYEPRNKALNKFLKSKPGAIQVQKKSYKLKYKDGPEYNTHVEATLPLFKGLGEEMHQKMYAALSLKSPADTIAKIKSEMPHYTWLDAMDFEVLLNENHILQFKFILSGVAAYPSTTITYQNLNTKTGEKLRAKDLFKPTSYKNLLADINLQFSKEKEESLASSPEANDVLSMKYNATSFTQEHLDNFIVSEKGLFFIYNYGFAHVMQALEPKGHFFISYKALKPYLKKNTILDVYVDKQTP